MEKSITDINFLYNHADKTLKHLSDNKIDHLELFLYSLLERIRNVSISLEILLKDNGRIHVHEYSIGILLRSALLDVLITLSLNNHIEKHVHLSEEDMKAELIKFAESFLSDGFEKTLQYAQLQRNDGLISEVELINFYTNMFDSYKDFFLEYNYDIKAPKLKSYYNYKYSPRKLFELNKNGKLKEMSNSVYDLYIYYSKYDHLSIFSLHFVRFDNEKKKEKITACIRFLIMHSTIVHYILQESYGKDSFLVEQSKTISDYSSNEILHT